MAHTVTPEQMGEGKIVDGGVLVGPRPCGTCRGTGYILPEEVGGADVMLRWPERQVHTCWRCKGSRVEVATSGLRLYRIDAMYGMRPVNVR